MKTSVEKKLREHPTWIAGKRFGHSVRRLLERYPEGAPDRVFAVALEVAEESVEEIYQGVMEKVRRFVLEKLGPL